MARSCSPSGTCSLGRPLRRARSTSPARTAIPAPRVQLTRRRQAREPPPTPSSSKPADLDALKTRAAHTPTRRQRETPHRFPLPTPPIFPPNNSVGCFTNTSSRHRRSRVRTTCSDPPSRGRRTKRPQARVRLHWLRLAGFVTRRVADALVACVPLSNSMLPTTRRHCRHRQVLTGLPVAPGGHFTRWLRDTRAARL